MKLTGLDIEPLAFNNLQMLLGLFLEMKFLDLFLMEAKNILIKARMSNINQFNYAKANLFLLGSTTNAFSERFLRFAHCLS